MRMPVLFVGHGSPMNAIEDTEFSRDWRKIADEIPTPDAILCISAHWQSFNTSVTAMKHPRTIYDFNGFPQELYNVIYPAMGSTKIAQLIKDTIQSADVELDEKWGLDHGTWSVLHQMYPKHNIPTLQLSINHNASNDLHYKLGQELAILRDQNILIIGSGNIVHNLGMLDFSNTPNPLAIEFDNTIKGMIDSRDDESIMNYMHLGKVAKFAAPTPEHFLPLLYILGAAEKSAKVSYYCESISLGSLSMRTVMFQ